MNNNITIYCKILIIQDNQYSDIIVEDLNREYTDDLKYVSVVKLPNWESTPFKEGDIGYLQFQYVEGGKTNWYNRSSGDTEIYKYTNNYFINFIKQRDICKQEKFEF